MLKKLIVAVVLLSFVSVLGCGGKGSGGTPPTNNDKSSKNTPANKLDDPYPMPRPGT
jgi:predicted small lipoprotein YifL